MQHRSVFVVRSASQHALGRRAGAYIGPEDIVRDGRQVHSRVFVRFEVDEGVVGDAFGHGVLWKQGERALGSAREAPRKDGVYGVQRTAVIGSHLEQRRFTLRVARRGRLVCRGCWLAGGCVRDATGSRTVAVQKGGCSVRPSQDGRRATERAWASKSARREPKRCSGSGACRTGQ